MKFDFIVADKINPQTKVSTRDGRQVTIEWVGPESMYGRIEGQEEPESWLIDGRAGLDHSLNPKDLIKI